MHLFGIVGGDDDDAVAGGIARAGGAAFAAESYASPLRRGPLPSTVAPLAAMSGGGMLSGLGAPGLSPSPSAGPLSPVQPTPGGAVGFPSTPHGAIATVTAASYASAVLGPGADPCGAVLPRTKTPCGNPRPCPFHS